MAVISTCKILFVNEIKMRTKTSYVVKMIVRASREPSSLGRMISAVLN